PQGFGHMGLDNADPTRSSHAVRARTRRHTAVRADRRRRRARLMPARRIRVAPALALREGFAAIRREAGVAVGFAREIEAEARAAGGPRPGRGRRGPPARAV